MDKLFKIFFVVAAAIVLHKIVNAVLGFIGWIATNQVAQDLFLESGLLWKLAAVIIVLLLYMLLVRRIRRQQGS